MIGRICEDRHAPADYRWFWSIAEHIDPALGIATNDRVPTLEEAKARFKSSWSKVREAREQKNTSSSKLREWQLVLIRSRGHLLERVKATSLETAEAAGPAAAKEFNLNSFHRKRLLLRERL